MSTHANIFVETEKDTFVGTYCHYDGYPEHMLPALSSISHDDLRGIILVAGLAGGMRFFNPPDEIETLDQQGYLNYLQDPDICEEGAHYIYIKKLDDTVQHRRSGYGTWESP